MTAGKTFGQTKGKDDASSVISDKVDEEGALAIASNNNDDAALSIERAREEREEGEGASKWNGRIGFGLLFLFKILIEYCSVDWLSTLFCPKTIDL